MKKKSLFFWKIEAKKNWKLLLRFPDLYPSSNFKEFRPLSTNNCQCILWTTFWVLYCCLQKGIPGNSTRVFSFIAQNSVSWVVKFLPHKEYFLRHCGKFDSLNQTETKNVFKKVLSKNLVAIYCQIQRAQMIYWTCFVNLYFY